MIDRLTGLRTGVDNRTEISARRGCADLRGSLKEFRDRLRFAGIDELRIVRNVVHRHDEHVPWRLRIHILDGDDVAVSVHELARNFAGDNFAKDAVRIAQGLTSE
jgi:hypothetical protein